MRKETELWRGRQWRVTPRWLETVRGCYRYDIEKGRLAESMQFGGWPHHMAGKTWVDVTDFIAAWKVAIALWNENVTPEQIANCERMALKHVEESAAWEREHADKWRPFSGDSEVPDVYGVKMLRRVALSSKPIKGQRFGLLVAVCENDNPHLLTPEWLCLCDCGDLHYATRKELLRGEQRTCGCCPDASAPSAIQQFMEE